MHNMAFPTVAGLMNNIYLNYLAVTNILFWKGKYLDLFILFLQVGDDSFGERYIENFKRNGVNTGISYVVLKIVIFRFMWYFTGMVWVN